ncbi:MAG: response regulator [Oculatellaceae cyanobacterium bins.114]|nr:response regulator [Oculatellaceae cyanobacterium bins.114]
MTFCLMYRFAIVDDNESWCFVLALRLQQEGYTVSTFTDVQTFLRQAARFDLVLVDFSMPGPRYQAGMDGPEVICQVKRRLQNPPLLVLISSFFTEELINHAADICPEADALLSKQTSAVEMIGQIKRLLERKDRFKPPSFQMRNRPANSDRMVSSATPRGQQHLQEQRTRWEHPE